MEIHKNDSSYFDWLPYAGVGIGTLTGLVGRIFEDSYSSTWIDRLVNKNQTMCQSAFQNSTILSAINGFKQFEIKNFALATPLLPLILEIVVDTAKDKSGKGILTRVAAAAKKNFTLEQVVYVGTFILFGLTSNFYCPVLGMCFQKGFNPSGHMMIKTLCATILSKSTSVIANLANRTRRHAFNALYAITDAVLIHNTVRYWHTAGEVLAGIAWGLSLTTGAELFLRKLKNASYVQFGSNRGKLQGRLSIST